MGNSKYTWIIVFSLIGACVERIEFDVPDALGILVIEGFITDENTPYSVKITRGFPLGSDSIIQSTVSGATVTLFDDMGHEEILTEKEPGLYTSNGVINGEVNHTYFIRIRTADGLLFESDPEQINPVGAIKNITYEFEPRTKVETFGEVDVPVFNIFVDADAGNATEQYIRWRYTGTYEVLNYPELHYTWNPPYTPYKNPWPCSGYILVGGPEGSGGILQQVGECTCCNCWVTLPEELPQLSDTQLISGNEFRHIKVGEVPINNQTFFTKFKVSVEQLSLTRTAFDFFKLIREQKENAASIFQPPSGEIRGNIRGLNNSNPVVGLFWAAAVNRQVIYLFPDDVPINLTPADFSTYPCYEQYNNATNQKPEGW